MWRVEIALKASKRVEEIKMNDTTGTLNIAKSLKQVAREFSEKGVETLDDKIHAIRKKS